MGLTALDMSDTARLAQLAANPQGTTREEIYLAVASLYRVQGAHLNLRERTLMTEILRRLTKDVEMAIRIALAERLADDASAPHDLIALLADDRIEVARPIILRNPLLTDDDVLRLIGEFGLAHHEAIADRPYIGEKVTEALAASEAETVLLALVRNTTARISSETYATLVEKSRRLVSIQEPLTRRRDLPPALALKMCEWVSDALKDYISRNYRIAPENLSSAVDKAQAAIREPGRAAPASADGARKLVEKLASSGQLKAGFLLRVLGQGQIDLFELALAQMLDLPVEQLRRRFYEGGPKSVALICRAVGIDRCVFSTVYTLSRRARGQSPSLQKDDVLEVEAVFNSNTKTSALAKLQAAA